MFNKACTPKQQVDLTWTPMQRDACRQDPTSEVDHKLSLGIDDLPH